MPLTFNLRLGCAVQHGHVERSARCLEFNIGRGNHNSPTGRIGRDNLVELLSYAIELLLKFFPVDFLLFRPRLFDDLCYLLISSRTINRTLKDSANDARLTVKRFLARPKVGSNQNEVE